MQKGITGNIPKKSKDTRHATNSEGQLEQEAPRCERGKLGLRGIGAWRDEKGAGGGSRRREPGVALTGRGRNIISGQGCSLDAQKRGRSGDEELTHKRWRPQYHVELSECGEKWRPFGVRRRYERLARWESHGGRMKLGSNRFGCGDTLPRTETGLRGRSIA